MASKCEFVVMTWKPLSPLRLATYAPPFGTSGGRLRIDGGIVLVVSMFEKAMKASLSTQSSIYGLRPLEANAIRRYDAQLLVTFGLKFGAARSSIIPGFNEAGDEKLASSFKQYCRRQDGVAVCQADAAAATKFGVAADCSLELRAKRFVRVFLLCFHRSKTSTSIVRWWVSRGSEDAEDAVHRVQPRFRIHEVLVMVMAVWELPWVSRLEVRVRATELVWRVEIERVWVWKILSYWCLRDRDPSAVFAVSYCKAIELFLLWVRVGLWFGSCQCRGFSSGSRAGLVIAAGSNQLVSCTVSSRARWFIEGRGSRLIAIGFKSPFPSYNWGLALSFVENYSLNSYCYELNLLYWNTGNSE
ncbi:hypothetical protein FNV43_RR19881 [Rhamnella rubrinervis]|uniref:Uncharacterized protein n=1 Tax=Rhamnella rubrinervis TaxID=2594499 RepID=A0A8K0GU31_9ROSA|nr:hypothetical protein FNV43_RR19881 [Rhamnella rubrinervis]